MRSQSAMVTNMEQGVDRIVLTYCFQRNNQETGQTALAALNMFTKQLAEQVLKLLPILLSRYKQLSAEGGFTWSWVNLSSVFSNMLKHTAGNTVYIIVDAVDECERTRRS